MKKLSKLFAVGTAAAMLLGLAACGGGSGDTGSERIGGTLVVYTPNEQTMLEALMPVFTEETGIAVEYVTAGTGELYTRIQNEAANPQGDVLFGGGVAQAMANSTLWEPYVGKNDSAMIDLGKNVGGYATPYQADGSNLLVNTQKVGNIKIEGYADLLNPALKGQIAFGDPANSSSAFAQLTNMLAAMGGKSNVTDNYTSDAGWDYVKQVMAQMNGQTIGSSSQVAKDVAQGESIVAMTYEAQSLNQLNASMPVKIVYPKEGAVFLPSGVEIIKGAKHMDQAKAFCDWIQSERAQQIIADQTSGRPLRDGIVKQGIPQVSEIKTLTEDSQYVSDHRSEIIAKYQQILASL